MNHSDARISILNSHITDEIFAAFGFETTGCHAGSFGLFSGFQPSFSLVWLMRRANIAQFGLAEAARRLLPRFVDDVKVTGVERIPLQGPLCCLKPPRRV